MKRMVVWVIFVLLTLTCVNISQPSAIAAQPGFQISVQPGFQGKYFNNKDLAGCPVLTRTDNTINFQWASQPAPTVNADNFSARWTGTITPKYTEKYTFTTTSDDGIRLWINNQPLIDNWTLHPATNNQGTIDLTANKPYEIRVEQFDAGGPATMQLYWSSPRQAKEVVSAVVHENEPQKNLVVNSSFEKPVVDYVGFEQSIEGWQPSEGGAIEIDTQNVNTPSDGSQFVELDANQVSKIEQDIPTEAGKTYKLSFAFSPRPGTADNKLNVRWGDSTVAQLDKNGEALTAPDWKVYSYDLKANGSSTRLSFDDLNETSDGLGSYLDAVSVQLCQ